MAVRPEAAAAPDDRDWMRAALGLAARALGRVAPNPAVGAVLVRGGRVLGRGVTGEGGRPHAESVALDEARRRWGAEAVRGATAYVTLEPCNHHGRTPPCAAALIEAGIARLVCPLEDPDPRVSGRGFAALRAAGVAVEVGLMAAEAAALNAGFLSVHARGRPWVRLKLATSLDGRIATASGESRWITGEAARRRVHLMRARSDAILIGAGTARADDPRLDMRLPGMRRRPVRVVLASRPALDPASRLATSARTQPVWLFHGDGASTPAAAALTAAGVRLVPVPTAPDGRPDPAAVLESLARDGITRLLVEGGGTVAASFLRAGLIDEIAVFAAGRIIGADGLPAVADLAVRELAAAPGFRLVGAEPVGGDLYSLWAHAAA